MPKKTITPDKYARDAEAWLQRGMIVYQAARALFDAGDTDPTLYFSAAPLGHTSLELVMKGILIGEGMVSFDPRLVGLLLKGARIEERDCVWGHSLLDLAEKLEQKMGFYLGEEMEYHNILFPPPFTVRQALEHFEPFFSELRYPHALENVSGFGYGDQMILEELVCRILALKSD